MKKEEATRPGLAQIDIDFLKTLQHEMLTQDKVCQAAPRFWVVRGTVREYDVNCESSNGEILKLNNDISFETVKEVYDYLVENYEDMQIKYKSPEILCYFDKQIEEWKEYEGLFNVYDFIEEYIDENAEIISYSEKPQIFQSTMFITLKECKEHIKTNHYHYPKDAHPYAMTAWRSEEVARLWDIIEKTNWDSLDLLE